MLHFAHSGLPRATFAAPNATPPQTPPDKQYTPQNNSNTQEDYNLPQDQWGRAYHEGLRQGYNAGRLFPQQLDQAYRQGLNDGYQAGQTR